MVQYDLLTKIMSNVFLTVKKFTTIENAIICFCSSFSGSILCKYMRNIYGEPVSTLSIVTELELLSFLIVGSECSFFQETFVGGCVFKKCDLTLIDPVHIISHMKDPLEWIIATIRINVFLCSCIYCSSGAEKYDNYERIYPINWWDLFA